jgi:hypothetical protein
VVPDNLQNFFLASAGVAGALIGLLFVAISVASGRLAADDAGSQLHRVRAAAALTSFINALAVSLFALVPVHKIGPAALVVAISGLAFVVAALLSMVRRGHVNPSTLHDVAFLLGLVITFLVQLVCAISVIARPADAGAVEYIAILVIVCFLIGIGRSWELIGGPSIGITKEVRALAQGHKPLDAVEEHLH